MFEIKNLNKVYGENGTTVEAVKIANLKVNKGEIVFITGPSGSGKTTVLSMMGLLLKPTSGEIYINNKNISSLKENQVSDLRLNNLGFVFQNFKLINNLTCLENVMIVALMSGMKKTMAKARAKELLENVGLKHRVEFYPEKLSGGEKQRVAIARALMNDPDIILADEPSANLDSKIGQEIAELLKKLADDMKKAMVIVTHDPRISWIADRIYSIEDGVLSEEKV